MLKVGEVMAATGDPVVAPPLGTDREITVGANSLFERITSEELWACTSCKACDEICPVNIEILDKILEYARRDLTLRRGVTDYRESDAPSPKPSPPRGEGAYRVRGTRARVSSPP